ncbi:YdhK family protein [Thalassobacillus hwangdonensis]|uniref:YdhK family protein n=1 Tax=Thalassobacillus hwangdonensis TaxID=546108 RepID=A0ABW3L4A6_9BACI
MLKKYSFILVIFIFLLAACSDNSENNASNENSNEQQVEKNESDHSGMSHSGSGNIPEGLKEAESPKFAVGDKAIIEDSHMEGMKGAEATVVGAFDTTVYTVSYDPVNGGETVTDHKWVIHEELKNPSEVAYGVGDEVILEADHMDGMSGAAATIDSAEAATVYMIDFTPTDGGEEVKNHKWVSEDELKLY